MLANQRGWACDGELWWGSDLPNMATQCRWYKDSYQRGVKTIIFTVFQPCRTGYTDNHDYAWHCTVSLYIIKFSQKTFLFLVILYSLDSIQTIVTKFSRIDFRCTQTNPFSNGKENKSDAFYVQFFRALGLTLENTKICFLFVSLTFN